jgi:hypothetical protein
LNTQNSPFLDELRNRIARTIMKKTFVETEAVIETNHVVIGTIGDNDYLRACYTVMTEIAADHDSKSNRLEKLADTLPKGGRGARATIRDYILSPTAETRQNAEEISALMHETAVLREQHGIAKGLFFFEVRQAFPELFDKCCVGVTKGWNVVWRDHEKDVGVLSVLIGGHERGGIDDLLGALQARNAKKGTD